jgi:Bacterial Ig-like domain
MRALPLLFASSFLFAGCPTRDQDPADGGGRDGNSPPNTVSITSPTTTTYTNGSVTIVVATGQPTTSQITIVATATSTQTIGTVTPPQTSFMWNTASVGEGTYSVTAQLTSNGQVATSNAITIVVDRTPPRVMVTNLVPAPGATDVVLAAPIEAVFSEAILPSTIGAGTIPIQTAGATTLPTSLSLSSDGKTATITITSDQGIKLGQALSGSFASMITDLAGNALVPLTTPWSWNVPAWIKYAPLNSNSLPLVAVGSNYQPIVGYTVCGAENPGNACPPVLHVAVSDGQAWNDLGVVEQGASTDDAAIFLDAANHPSVGWGYETPGGVGEVVFATWDGSAWQSTTYPPIVLPAEAGTNVDAIALTLDSLGHPVVAYRADVVSPTAKTDIYVASWTGTTWDPSLGAVGDPTSKTFDVVMNDEGAPIVSVVNSNNASGAFIWNGTSWAFTAGSGAANASVGLDPSGNPVMLNSITTSWVPDHLTNGTWLPLVSSPVPSSTTASNPSLATTSDRLPVVAWYDPAQSPPAIGLARWSGTAWDNRAGFANAGGAPNAFPPALVVDGRNEIWIGWVESLQLNVWMSNY